MVLFLKRFQVMSISLILLVTLSSCADNPTRQKLANPNSSYYSKIKAAAARLDGDEKVARFYEDPKNKGLDYYQLQRKNQVTRQQLQREKANRERAKNKSENCSILSGVANGFKGLTMAVNAAISAHRGDSIVKGAATGAKLAERESWVKATKAGCP